MLLRILSLWLQQYLLFHNSPDLLKALKLACDLDEALADFSESYADQNELDYKALVQAVQKGRLEVYLER